jgi:hypothetical protein
MGGLNNEARRGVIWVFRRLFGLGWVRKANQIDIGSL